MNEKNIEQKLIREIKALGGLCYKWVSPGNAGVPDRIVFLPGGKIIFIELKQRSGRSSEIQKVQIRRLRNLGADVRLLIGEDAVKKFLDDRRFLLEKL